MADQKVNIKVTAEGAKKAQGDLKGVEGAISKMGKTVAKVTGAFYASKGLINGITQVVTISSQLESVRRGFDNLAQSSGFSADTLQKLQKATNGTMNSMDLMTQANNAMLLGITDSEDQMAEMFDVAQRLASALGQDTAFGVESLTTGLGRQSKLMLDNLGIMFDVEDANKKYAESVNKSVSELTDQERKQAFVNEAMFQARDLVDSLGEEQLTTADSILQMKTAVFELAVTLGDQLSPFVVELSGKLVKLTNDFGDLVNGMKGVETNAETIANLRDSIQKVNDVMELTKELTNDPSGAFPTRKLKEFNDSMKELGFDQEMIANSQVLLANNSEEFNSHMKGLIATLQSEIDALLASQPKVISGIDAQVDARKKLNEELEKGKTAEEERYVTTLSGARSAIQAYLAQAVASMLVAEIGAKGLAGLVTGSIGAIAVTSAFDELVPKFAQGGIVQGDPSRGDVVPVMATAGELILNQAQQENLVANSGITINISAPLVDETVVDSIIPAIERAKSLGTA